MSDQLRRLRNATRSLAHRGPDSEAVWISHNGRAGLGHRRLSVCGDAEASQPIMNEAGNVTVVVNGELYDPSDALRRRLISQGHRFRGGGDSELAVHLYEQYGVDFVEHLRGEFAILVYDSRIHQLVAVRDRFGIKPLVYAQLPGAQWWFASQVQALGVAGLSQEVDEESVWHAMSFQYTLPDRTLTRGVRQLPPGHLAIIANERVKVRQYWDCDYPTDCEINSNHQELVQGFSAQLSEAVRLRLRGDVPVVSHLSGGIDSASVTGIAATGLSAAFTVSFSGSEDYDETDLADELSRRFSLPLHQVDGSPERLLEALPLALRYSEGWAVNGHLPAKYLLNQAIKNAGYKVALTGEGADELLAGYPHLRIDLGRHSGDQHADRILTENQASAGIMLAAGQRLDVTAVQRTLGFVPAFVEAKASLGSLLHSHLHQDFVRAFAHRDPYQDLIDAIATRDQLQNRHPVQQSLYLWIKTALCQYILRTLGDGCESAHGVEGRLPMLDHQLFDWVKTCPLSVLFRPNSGAPPTEKWILRDSMRRLLPSRIVRRPKHPFVAPPLGDRLAEYGRERDLLESMIDDHPYMDSVAVRKTLNGLANAPRSARIATDPLWWTLMSSAIHHQQIQSARDVMVA